MYTANTTCYIVGVFTIEDFGAKEELTEQVSTLPKNATIR
jgi:hypothetical protein